jgi:hypothetical protein
MGIAFLILALPGIYFGFVLGVVLALIICKLVSIWISYKPLTVNERQISFVRLCVLTLILWICSPMILFLLPYPSSDNGLPTRGQLEAMATNFSIYAFVLAIIPGLASVINYIMIEISLRSRR